MGSGLQEKSHAAAAGESAPGFRAHHGGSIGTAPAVAGKRTFRRLAGRCSRFAPARTGKNLTLGNSLLIVSNLHQKRGIPVRPHFWCILYPFATTAHASYARAP